MFGYLGILTAARWQVFWNGIKHAKTGAKVGMVFGAIVVLALMVFSFIIAFVIADLPNLLQNVTPQQLDRVSPGLQISDLNAGISRIISFIFLAVFVFLLFGGIGAALGNLYLSRDMEMLLAAPIPMRAVFISKFITGLTFIYFLLFGFGLPYLIGTGIGLGYHWSYYPIAVLTLLTLPLIPSGIGALITIGLARLLPATRIRDILTVISGLIAVSFYLLGQLPNLLRSNRELANGATSLASRLGGLDISLVPSTWGVRAMEAAGQANWGELLYWGVLFFGVSIGLYIVCVLVAERAYYSGWSNVNIVGGKSRARMKADRARRLATQRGDNVGYSGGAMVAPFSSNGSGASVGAIMAHAPMEIVQQSAGHGGGPLGGTGAVISKDYNTLRRDLTGLTQLLWPIAVSIVLMLQINRPLTDAGLPGLSSDFDAALRNLRFLLPAGVVLFASVSIGAYYGLSGLSRERRGIWMLKLAPVSPWAVMSGKFIVAYTPMAVFSICLSLIYGLIAKFDPFTILASMVVGLLLGLGVTGICVGLGGALPRLDWDNPQRQNSTAAGCLFIPLFILYALLAAGSLAGGVLLGAATHTPLFIAGGILLCLVFTAIAVFVPMLIACNKFEQLEV